MTILSNVFQNEIKIHQIPDDEFIAFFAGLTEELDNNDVDYDIDFNLESNTVRISHDILHHN